MTQYSLSRACLVKGWPITITMYARFSADAFTVE